MKKQKNNIIPNHIAFIIDGNGRWAKRHKLTRSMGHKAGIDRCKEILTYCSELKLNCVSVYCFSTENWNRPKDEVNFLFKLFRDFINDDISDLLDNDVKLVVSGDYNKFPKDLISAINDSLEKTKNNKGLILNLCLNYGGRPEIVNAVNNVIKKGIKSVTEKSFTKYLYTAELPELDFLIRTSGECRLSNFMLWQSAYAEFYFPKTMWPDFTKKQLDKALRNFAKRNRRFGAIK